MQYSVNWVPNLGENCFDSYLKIILYSSVSPQGGYAAYRYAQPAGTAAAAYSDRYVGFISCTWASWNHSVKPLSSKVVAIFALTHTVFNAKLLNEVNLKHNNVIPWTICIIDSPPWNDLCFTYVSTEFDVTVYLHDADFTCCNSSSKCMCKTVSYFIPLKTTLRFLWQKKKRISIFSDVNLLKSNFQLCKSDVWHWQKHWLVKKKTLSGELIKLEVEKHFLHTV